MSLSTLDHCSIRTTRLAETRDFYVDVLGMETGTARISISRATGFMSARNRLCI